MTNDSNDSQMTCGHLSFGIWVICEMTNAKWLCIIWSNDS